MQSSGVDGARSEPRSRKLPQSDAGGSRDGTSAKDPVVRRKEATRVRRPREEHRKANSRQDKSKANSRREKHRRSGGRTTRPKAEPTAETKARAKADAKAKSTPKSFRVEDRTGGDWEFWNRVGSRRQMRRERRWKQMCMTFLRQPQWQ